MVTKSKRASGKDQTGFISTYAEAADWWILGDAEEGNCFSVTSQLSQFCTNLVTSFYLQPFPQVSELQCWRCWWPWLTWRATLELRLTCWQATAVKAVKKIASSLGSQTNHQYIKYLLWVLWSKEFGLDSDTTSELGKPLMESLGKKRVENLARPDSSFLSTSTCPRTARGPGPRYGN